ncbi:protein Flattop [Alosa sapidissima]|uniref:protein Flattop n=1 Tax=Alosa sapidissima TaxID=34773 RepID=UPI001C09F4F3|nr:protein Flattop [Alosa sapidissima]
MSSSFSANQYDGAYKAQKLQNWTVPKHFKERPSAADGHTTFITNDHGHLLPGMKAKNGSAWTSFVGTWDLPNRIPPTYINPTARSHEGQERLKNWNNRKGTTKKASSPRSEADAQNTGRASKTQEELTTDPPVNQEQPLGPAPEHRASPTTCGPPDSARTPEPYRPTSQQSPVPSQKSAANSRPASQNCHCDGQPNLSNE